MVSSFDRRPHRRQAIGGSSVLAYYRHLSPPVKAPMFRVSSAKEKPAAIERQRVELESGWVQ